MERRPSSGGSTPLYHTIPAKKRGSEPPTSSAPEPMTLLPRAATWRASSPHHARLARSGSWTDPGHLSLAIAVHRHGRRASSLRLLYAASIFGSLPEHDSVHCQFGGLGLDALALRDGELKGSGRPVEYSVVGDGPLRPDLEGLISTLQIQETVHLVGALPREEVTQYLRPSRRMGPDGPGWPSPRGTRLRPREPQPPATQGIP